MESQQSPSGGGDPLGAMYFLAAVVMGLVFAIIVGLVFIPQGAFSRPGGENVYTPSPVPTVSEPASGIEESAEALRQAEELHMH